MRAVVIDNAISDNGSYGIDGGISGNLCVDRTRFARNTLSGNNGGGIDPHVACGQQGSDNICQDGPNCT